MVQHSLDEILRIPGVYSLQSVVIQKNSLALGERETVVRVWGRQESSLSIHNHI